MKKTIKRRTVPDIAHTLPDGLPDRLKQIYLARGITTTEELTYGLQHLHPFTLLMGIEQAVTCLHDALTQQKRFLIIGDFDADGATSTALAVSALRVFGAKHVEFLVPNRFDYGYGLTPEIVAVGAKWKPDVIITVDNGIASHAGVDAANDLGIQVIVTDHHLPGETLPNAAAIVNPNQHDDPFPSKNLAGVGVIFYVMLALRAHLREQQWFSAHHMAEPNLAQFLDLVALGTVADVVPLDHNNRILVHQGLNRIRAGKARAGIRALLEIANRDQDTLQASDLGFAIGPRLNAAGRLDDMALGIDCLLSTNTEQAREKAQWLDDLNRERRVIENDMKQQAFVELNKLQLKAQAMPVGLCLFDPNWHQGVIGILASRIKDQFHRPVIAFANADEHTIKGSARSITGVHIRDVLDAVATKHPGLITKFGGHAMAAGLSLPRENFSAFEKVFTEMLATQLKPEDLQGEFLTDGELAPEDFTLTLATQLRQAGPFGQAFPAPLFDGQFRIVDQRIVGTKHLKLMVEIPGTMQRIGAIHFNVDLDQWPNSRCEVATLVYRLEVNTYQGINNLQLMVERIEISPSLRGA